MSESEYISGFREIKLGLGPDGIIGDDRLRGLFRRVDDVKTVKKIPGRLNVEKVDLPGHEYKALRSDVEEFGKWVVVVNATRNLMQLCPLRKANYPERPCIKCPAAVPGICDIGAQYRAALEENGGEV